MKPSEAVRQAAKLATEVALERDRLISEQAANLRAQTDNMREINVYARAAAAAAMGRGPRPDAARFHQLTEHRAELEAQALTIDELDREQRARLNQGVQRLADLADQAAKTNELLETITSKVAAAGAAAAAAHRPDFSELLTIEAMRKLNNLDLKAGKLTVTQLFEEYREAHRAEWTDADNHYRRDYLPALRLFIAMLGRDPAIEELTTADSVRFAKHMIDWAASNGRKLTTAEKYLDYVGAVFRYAEDGRYVRDLSGALRIKGAEAESYQAFTADELRQLFEHVNYQEHAFTRAAAFWVPLVCLHTGNRLEEIAGLRLEDAGIEVDGIPCFRLSADGIDGTKRGKNRHAKRTVPLHASLVEAGFLRYVAVLRSEGHEFLFPCLPVAERDGRGKAASEDFRRFRQLVGIGAQRGEGRGTKAAHSFRSTLVSALQGAGVSGELRRILVGHAPSDIHDKIYSQGMTPVAIMSDALNKAHFDFKLPVWKDTDMYRWSRKNGKAFPLGNRTKRKQ